MKRGSCDADKRFFRSTILTSWNNLCCCEGDVRRVLCIGLGVAGRLLREAADMNGTPSGVSFPASQVAKAIMMPPLAASDAFLARLIIAEGLLKDGFDPSQPRDGHGRWIDGGDAEDGGTADDAATLDPLPPAAPAPEANGSSNGSGMVGSLADAAASSLLETSTIEAIAGLAEIAARFTAVTAFLGMVFVPANDSLISSGTLPGDPDITFHYDRGTGVLTLYLNGQEIFSGQSDIDGIFSDENGEPFGRRVAGSLVLDPDAPIYNSKSDARDDSEAGAQAQTDVATDRPKLCPDPEPEKSISGRSERALAYQEQITGLPRGLAVELNSVSFDGCRESDGTMLEAKGQGFEWAMTSDGEWRINYHGVIDIMAQAQNQFRAAGNRTIEWYFAEEPVANYFRQRFEGAGWKNISVFYRPYGPPENR